MSSIEVIDEIWRKPQVLSAIGMGNTWLYEAMALGYFPKGVRIGARARGWRKSEVMAWLASREAA